MAEIDTATTEILMNDTRNGNLSEIYKADGSGETFNIKDRPELIKIYKKYLSATREECSDTNNCTCSQSYLNTTASAGVGLVHSFYLKDGACFGFTLGAIDGDRKTILPGEEAFTTGTSYIMRFVFDSNGKDAPNAIGKDIFILPVGLYGIIYENQNIPTATEITDINGWMLANDHFAKGAPYCIVSCGSYCGGMKQAGCYNHNDGSTIPYSCYCKN